MVNYSQKYRDLYIEATPTKNVGQWYGLQNQMYFSFSDFFVISAEGFMNDLLGKTAKAMYKLSGKTLQQLSDETGKTVDCINNLFYARIQKPDLFGVTAFVEATGYTMDQLTGFLKQAKNFPKGTDITAEFTKYIDFAEDTASGVSSALPKHDEKLIEKLHESYREQITQMEDSYGRLKNHYDHSVEQIKKAHGEELKRFEKEIRRFRIERIALVLLLFGTAAAAIVFACLFFSQ